MAIDLDELQVRLTTWARAAFGDAHVDSIPQRALRLLEEAIELAQAAGVDEQLAAKLVRFVYARPVGDLWQEIGGVGVTLLVLAESAHFGCERAIDKEAARVLSKPIEHFTRRNAAKGAAGFDIVPGKLPTTEAKP